MNSYKLKLKILSFSVALFSGLGLAAQLNYDCLSENVSKKNTFLEMEQAKSDSLNLLLNSILASYPELNDSKIVIKRKNIQTLAAARPSGNFLFKNKKNREYTIVLNKSESFYADSLYYYMPCLGFKGLLAHELGHLVDYSGKSAIRVIGFGIAYSFKKKKVERAVDKETICRGYGQELLVFNQYILNSPFSSSKYLKNKEKNYLSVVEISESLETF